MADILHVTDNLNKAVHGETVTPGDTQKTIAVGARILADLSAIE